MALRLLIRLSLNCLTISLLLSLQGTLQSQTAVTNVQPTSPSSTLPHVVKYTGSATGMSSVTFAIYDREDSLTPLWLETQSVTPDESGHYTVLLGSTTAEGLPAS